MSHPMEPHIVLIVDDEERLRRAMEKALGQQEDYRAMSAASGEEAIAVMEEMNIDLVITDLVMPGMGGMALVRHIKGVSPNVKTIIITAYGSPESMAEAESLGVDCYLEKPFDLSHLKSKVNELLHAGDPPEEVRDSSRAGSCLTIGSGVIRACCSGAGRAMGATARVSRKALRSLSPRNVLASAGRATRAVAGAWMGIQGMASGLVSRKSEVNGQ